MRFEYDKEKSIPFDCKLDYEGVAKGTGLKAAPHIYLERKFRALKIDYTTTVAFAQGSGQRGQRCIDASYQKLLEFVNQHTAFKTFLPRKAICYDDGTGGFFTAHKNLQRSIAYSRF